MPTAVPNPAVGIAAAIGSAAGPISSALRGSRDSHRAKIRRNEQWQRDDRRITRTVADARNAGIHPLFALGGSIGSGGASATAPIPPTGNYVGKALQAIKESRDNKTRLTQSTLVDKALIDQSRASTRESNARAATAEWNLANSINKRQEVISNVTQDIDVTNPEPVRKLLPENKFVGPPRPRTTQQEWGGQSKIDPRVNTAQENEDIHGEIMGNLYTTANEAIRWKRKVNKSMWANIRKFVLPNVSVRKRNLLYKYAKPANPGAHP